MATQEVNGKRDTTSVHVAVIGNPNTGKSTLFSALCGIHQRVGNYPGVTVEKKTGHTTIAGHDFTLIDLPGTYSLAPRSPDEVVAVDVLLGRRSDTPLPDVVLVIVDATNLERNLYLVCQLMELGRPLVVALNMMDLATSRGITIDVRGLQEQLDVPVVPLVAARREGLDELKQALERAVEAPPPGSPEVFPEPFEREVAALERVVAEATGARWPAFLIERLLLDAGHPFERDIAPEARTAIEASVAAARERLAEEGLPVPAVEAMSRYEWVRRKTDGVVRRTARGVTWSERIDRIVTHRVGGLIVFGLVMLVMFQSIFRWAEPMMSGIESVVDLAKVRVAAFLPEGLLQSLVADGIVAGVGNVLVFLPQIAILFLFIAILEDCGYMARAAFLMDRVMSFVGLNGKSFIPLLSSFACAVPGIMATRVIANRRDRLTTILVTPLMSCSARLPVYMLLAYTFIPDREIAKGWLSLPALVITGMYLLGIVTAFVVAWLLRRCLFHGESSALVMELPAYKWPSWRVVGLRVWDRAWAFVKRAGTIILAVTVLVWAAGSFPRDTAHVRQVRQRMAGRPDEQAAVKAAIMQGSILGRMGRIIEPAVRPLGWDWRIGCAVIASFPAREVVIGAMGVIYELGEGHDESSTRLKDRLRRVTWDGTDRPVYTTPVALGLMVFFALCAQCAATLVVIRRETGRRRWALFTFAYMTTLAYVGTFITYHVATWWLS